MRASTFVMKIVGLGNFQYLDRVPDDNQEHRDGNLGRK